MVEYQGGTGIGMLDGVVLLGGALVVTGVGNQTALHQHSAVGDGLEVSGGGGTGKKIATATMITGGCRRLEGIVILRLPGVVGVEVGTVGEVEGGRGTRGLVVHPAGTPDMTERVVNSDWHASRGYHMIH